MRFVRERMQDLRKQSYTTYVRALKRNRSTLVMVSITDMFDANGVPPDYECFRRVAMARARR
jgi:hypothetical protein